MTLLGFKDRFVGNVGAGYLESIGEAGAIPAGVTPKRHSIRRTHKDGRAPAKVGVPIQLYARVRQKDMHKIVAVDPVCTKVEQIRIERQDDPDFRYSVIIGATGLLPPAVAELATGDGFESIGAFLDFFVPKRGDVFSGHIIHWDWL